MLSKVLADHGSFRTSIVSGIVGVDGCLDAKPAAPRSCGTFARLPARARLLKARGVLRAVVIIDQGLIQFKFRFGDILPTLARTFLTLTLHIFKLGVDQF